MPSAYVVSNALAPLAPLTAITNSGFYDDATQRPLLVDGRMDKQVVFTVDSEAIIGVDFGTAITLTGWALLNHNLANLGAGTVTISAANDSGFTSGVVVAKATTTLNFTPPRHRDHVLQFAAVSRRYWSLEFQHGSIFQMRLGELFPFVASTQLTRGYTDGSSEPEEILSVGAQMMYGERRDVFLGGPMRHKRMRFQDYTTANNAELLAMWRATQGPVNPLLWIESYEAVSTAAAVAQQDCIYGKLELQTFEAPFTDFDLVQPPELIIRQKGRGAGL